MAIRYAPAPPVLDSQDMEELADIYRYRNQESHKVGACGLMHSGDSGDCGNRITDKIRFTAWSRVLLIGFREGTPACMWGSGSEPKTVREGLEIRIGCEGRPVLRGSHLIEVGCCAAR